MFFRLFRIRLLIVRSCIISFIIILFLQIVSFFNVDHIPLKKTKTFKKELKSENLFWKKLSDEDKALTDQQRVKQIELIKKQTTNNELNWTNAFFESYARKLKILNERDDETIYKHRFKQSQQIIPQNTFEVFEETLVS